MQNLDLQKLAETVAFIRTKTNSQPIAGIILGSGLGGLVNDLTISISLNYEEIPHFPTSTVKGHGGKLLFGTLNGKEVVMLSGRFHYYEGYHMQEVTFPVRVMQQLGATLLMVSNAAGSMNASYQVGDLMIINDHINLFPEHPLRGKNDENIGPRFPDMTEPYQLSLIQKAKQIASSNHIHVHEGVYIGLQGPTFETKAEYKWLHIIGGDAVGMSTVPEVIVAIHCGMKVFGMSVITDIGIREAMNVITHEEVLEAANAAAPKMALIFKELLGEL
ncbi:MAG: purine-nucleoside phosphorylase [Bacteroidetes bacterium]|jgi:purine-nucleoside phosphorylase|nr:purine-nucleoside phosphorylase [Bacteroidota bacterium]MBK7040561.1 purine-nucleoside phosphorylase [Bacteroidota bacterium]